MTVLAIILLIGIGIAVIVEEIQNYKYRKLIRRLNDFNK